MPADWKARLGGDNWSLRGLDAWLGQERHKVKREDGHYYLTSPDLTACRDEDEAWKVAEQIVERINRAAKVFEPGFRPVNVGALVHTAPDGTRRSSVRVSTKLGVVARARFEATVTRADGSAEPSRLSVVERFVALQESEGPDSAVARALEQWELPKQTPTSLNNILEIIRDDVSGGKRAWGTMAQALAPEMRMSAQKLDDELRRCRESLHDPAAVGPLARHGSPGQVANPMNLREAEDFVDRLLRAWLRGKV